MRIERLTQERKAVVEKLITDAFKMDAPRYRLIYDRDPRCRAENVFVATKDDRVIGVNGFREVAVDGLWADGRPAGAGIVSGATVVKEEFRRQGISTGIFRDAWTALGRQYSFCLGFTRQELYSAYLREVGFGARPCLPTILYEKSLVPVSRVRALARRRRSAGVLQKYADAEGGTAAEDASPGDRVVRLDARSLPAAALTHLYRSHYGRRGRAIAVRDDVVWQRIAEERDVFAVAGATARGETDFVGYCIVRSDESESVVEELVAGPHGLRRLIAHVERSARTEKKERVRVHGDPAHATLCSREVGFSAYEIEYLALFRALEPCLRALRITHGGLIAEDEFLGQSFDIGAEPSLRVNLVDLIEYLWQSLDLSSLLGRIGILRGSRQDAAAFLEDFRRQNLMSPIDFPYLELY